MCPDSCANLGLNAQLGVGSAAALAQHMARIELTQKAEFFLVRLGSACPSGKAERCQRCGKGWETVGMEQLDPLGDMRALLTPGGICSSPGVFPSVGRGTE